uniref:hypothetical protein n=1 Tax=Jatropha curcas TaxID=180498 RepID=UPI00279FEC80|nr:hypothetical protein QLP06_mgp038 [Jatropha curcas]WFG81201.1 hypothetical protein [Jatropha curcas]
MPLSVLCPQIQVVPEFLGLAKLLSFPQKGKKPRDPSFLLNFTQSLNNLTSRNLNSFGVPFCFLQLWVLFYFQKKTIVFPRPPPIPRNEVLGLCLFRVTPFCRWMFCESTFRTFFLGQIPPYSFIIDRGSCLFFHSFRSLLSFFKSQIRKESLANGSTYLAYRFRANRDLFTRSSFFNSGALRR